ncbi:carbohydrate ABC transporter permease [Phototrophicus methaneseepsis]|uniref:Carbohydrate ABC transporter permease n=1 Tax=Phototrophicus methaneseepsis TaxID=2710758 RepID=A0A7S8IEJ3_9CHLR|nr:carbohydrate ABC transporter permease [Phototrophicus methaneseepsis]QPC83730.1 carbohydrate ABC transporter permease [Phototrophicus methaneseepsis]
MSTNNQHFLRRLLIPRYWPVHLMLILATIVMLYPLLWMVSSSLKPETEIFQSSGLIPSELTFSNYTEGWTALQTPFTRFYINSFIIVILVVIGNVLTSSLTGYAFARVKFPGKRIWFSLMLLTLMLPFHVTLVPRYIMFSELNWINTILPLVVPSFLATEAFFVFLNVQFIRGIPRDLDEAASVDGASRWQIFTRIIFPLSTPALITTAIFSFIWTWNDFLSQLLYLNKTELLTVPLALRQFVSAMDQSSYGQLFAMSTLAQIPILLFFVFGQKYIVEGIATTGFKG